MNHASNSLGGVAAERRFSAMEAHGRGNLLNSNELTLDFEDLADQFLPALSLPTHMTAEHGYLRLA